MLEASSFGSWPGADGVSSMALGSFSVGSRSEFSVSVVGVAWL